MENRNCESCKGKGKHDARTLSTGYVIPEKSCFSCKGTGTFQPINESEILNAILVSPKNKKPRLRSTKPKGNDRAAYVWRMARSALQARETKIHCILKRGSDAMDQSE